MTGRSENSRRSPLARIAGVIVDPDPTFEDIVKRPDSSGPILLILITAALGIIPILSSLQRLPEMVPSNVPAPPASLALAGGIVGAVLTFLIWWPIRALIFSGVGFFLGSRVEYARSLAVSGYLNVVPMLSGIIGAISQGITGRSVTLGLGMALQPEQAATPLGVTLSSVTVFGIIYIVLSTIALSKLWKVKKSKSAAAAVVMWLVTVALSAGGAHLTSQMTSMFQISR